MKLPDNMFKIPLGLFYNCSCLTETSLPSKIVSIETSAFANTGLKSITIPAKVEFIYSDAFGYCNNLAKITIPSGVKNIDGGFQ